MTERQGRAFLGNAAGRSAAGGLVPRDTVNIIQSLGPSFNVGAFQGIDPAELIILVARTTVAARYTSLRTTLNGTGGVTGTGYTVPSGRQLVIGSALYVTNTAGIAVVIGYADDNINDAAGPPTNAVGLTPANLLMTAAAATLYVTTLALKVPAGKIPYLYGNAGVEELLVVCKLFNA